jgi:hypothetical protein
MSKNPKPSFRKLRAYAFDPGMAIQLDTALINMTTYKIIWEELAPGPSGEYIEVIDYDPSTHTFYEPVDLDDKYLVATDGLSPSEGNPQYHQQMVYAVAMTTIKNFEKALGRPSLWAARITVDEKKHKLNYEYVQQLRIYPHALREDNAYYSPNKKALLLGYFQNSKSTELLPSGSIYACLSSDIIAHETTHALLDGMFKQYAVASNKDTFAFHEAFADVVALFQHFTIEEVLVHQITQTKGDLNTDNLLGQMAQEFGKARGNYGALRDAIGKFNEQTKLWERKVPDPSDYESETEAHARGAILVSAIFEAFISIYNNRIKDLYRIASNGTGVMPAGNLHPDLVLRLAKEASKTATHVLNMCIRALDYCPPVDINFGDYLRAIITADVDIEPEDEHNYRVAFIQAFRRRGIFPEGVTSLSVDSLRYPTPNSDDEEIKMVLKFITKNILQEYIHKISFTSDRKKIFNLNQEYQEKLHEIFKYKFRLYSELEKITSIKLKVDPANKITGMNMDKSDAGLYSFEVHRLAFCTRVTPSGDTINQIVINFMQSRKLPAEYDNIKFKGGCTLILDETIPLLKYCITKRIDDEVRMKQAQEFESQFALGIREIYSSQEYNANSVDDSSEPFCIIHNL